jgi:hypothetical protein
MVDRRQQKINQRCQLRNMTDDCANKWGCQLVEMSNEDTLQESFRDGVEAANTFQDLVEECCSPFQLLRVESCGSAANMYAINAATDLEPRRCLIACGSYVSGDHGPLQQFTSSHFSDDDRFSIISDPNNCSETSKHVTIAFPYYIPGCENCMVGCVKCREDFDIQKEYEQNCARMLHVTCLKAIANGSPFKSIFFELILHGSGAMLHPRFLKTIVKLARTHQLAIMVDEIMTGGRSGKMLYIQHCPKEFIRNVSYVTLGKWVGCGMVLENPNLTTKIATHDTYRGTSTTIGLSEPYLIFKKVSKCLRFANTRRKQFIERMGLLDHQVWGVGTLIFCHLNRLNSTDGLKTRYLPLLEDIPFMSFKRIAISHCMKSKVAVYIKNQVFKWLFHFQEKENTIDQQLCTYIASNNSEKTVQQYAVLISKLLIHKREVTEQELRTMINNLELAGFVQHNKRYNQVSVDPKWETLILIKKKARFCY